MKWNFNRQILIDVAIPNETPCCENHFFLLSCAKQSLVENLINSWKWWEEEVKHQRSNPTSYIQIYIHFSVVRNFFLLKFFVNQIVIVFGWKTVFVLLLFQFISCYLTSVYFILTSVCFILTFVAFYIKDSFMITTSY